VTEHKHTRECLPDKVVSSPDYPKLVDIALGVIDESEGKAFITNLSDDDTTDVVIRMVEHIARCGFTCEYWNHK
jgi:hypothetical protein